MYLPKHAKLTDETLMRMLIPSFLGIIVCMFCLFGATWAWFSQSVQTSRQTVTSANFHVDVSIDPAPEHVDKNGYLLKAGQTYEVTLHATGTAPSGGYCVVEGEGKVHRTIPMLAGDRLSFSIEPGVDAVYTFTVMWGKRTDTGEADLFEGSIIGNKTAENSAIRTESTAKDTAQENFYIVQAGDTLQEIAAAYHVTVDALMEQNHLNDADFLSVGQKLSIPSPSFEKEAASSSRETVQSEPVSEECVSSQPEEPPVLESSVPSKPSVSGADASQPQSESQPSSETVG